MRILVSAVARRTRGGVSKSSSLGDLQRENEPQS